MADVGQIFGIPRRKPSPIQRQAGELIRGMGSTFPLIEAQNIEDTADLPIALTNITLEDKQAGTETAGSFYPEGITEEGSPMLMSALRRSPFGGTARLAKGPLVNITKTRTRRKARRDSTILHEFMHKTFKDLRDNKILRMPKSGYSDTIDPDTHDLIPVDIHRIRHGPTSLNEEDYTRLFQAILNRGDDRIQKGIAEYFDDREMVTAVPTSGEVYDRGMLPQDNLLANPDVLKNMTRIKREVGMFNVKEGRRPPPQAPTIGLIPQIPADYVPSKRQVSEKEGSGTLGKIFNYFSQLGSELNTAVMETKGWR